MSDPNSDGNVMVDSGHSPAPAGPPSSRDSDTGAGFSGRDRQRLTQLADELDPKPARERNQPDARIEDLDKPRYADPNDPRAKLAEPTDARAPTERPAQPEIEPPRSWNKELKEWFAGLPEADKKAAIAQRVNEQDAEVRRAQNEAASVRQQAAEQLRQEVERVQAAERVPYEARQAVEQQSAAQGAFRSLYPGVETAEQIQQFHQGLIAKGDTATAEQFAAHVQELHGYAQNAELAFRRAAEHSELMAAEQHRQDRQRFDGYAKQEDEKFAAAVPEFRDEAKAAAFREKALMPMLKEVGITPSRAAELWHNHDLFRSAEAQRLMYFAAKGYAAEQAARNSTPTLRRPQSPGVYNGSRGDDAASAAQRGDMAAYVVARAKQNGARR